MLSQSVCTVWAPWNGPLEVSHLQTLCRLVSNHNSPLASSSSPSSSSDSAAPMSSSHCCFSTVNAWSRGAGRGWKKKKNSQQSVSGKVGKQQNEEIIFLWDKDTKCSNNTIGTRFATDHLVEFLQKQRSPHLNSFPHAAASSRLGFGRGWTVYSTGILISRKDIQVQVPEFSSAQFNVSRAKKAWKLQQFTHNLARIFDNFHRANDSLIVCGDGRPVIGNADHVPVLQKILVNLGDMSVASSTFQLDYVVTHLATLYHHKRHQWRNRQNKFTPLAPGRALKKEERTCEIPRETSGFSLRAFSKRS